MAAFGIIACDQIARSAARTRLQVGEIGFHARDWGGDFAALRRWLRAEKQELAVAAAERTGVGPSTPKVGPLTFNRRLRAARTAAGGDCLLQTGALGVLRQRNVGAERDDRGREPGQGADRRQKSALSKSASHAYLRRPHLVNRLRAFSDPCTPGPSLVGERG